MTLGVVTLAGDVLVQSSRFSLCVCLRARSLARSLADDGLLVSWIFHADAPGSPTGALEPLFANARGYVLTGANLLLLLLC